MLPKKAKSLPTYQRALLQVVGYKIIRSIVNEVLERHELNTTQWIIIGLVKDNPDSLRIKDVATTLYVEGSFITILVNELVARKYLQTKVSPHDSRARILVLAPGMPERIDSIEQELKVRLAKLDTHIKQPDLDTYFAVLATFVEKSSILSSQK